MIATKNRKDQYPAYAVTSDDGKNQEVSNILKPMPNGDDGGKTSDN